VPRYTYYTYDLLTNQQIDDVPMYGVSFDRQLSSVGTFTGTFRLDDERKTSQGLLDATLPGRTSLYIDRDGALIWGGIIWSRTYQSQSRSMQVYAETFESYLHKRVIKATAVFNTVDPMNIARSIWNTAQADPRGDIDVIVPGAFTTTQPISKTFSGYEYSNAGQAIDDLASADTGFDFYIQVAYDSGMIPTKTLLIGRPLGAMQNNTGLVFQYPGSIENYWFPESAGSSTTTLYGVGKGDGAAAIQTSASNADLLTAGYPILEDVESFKDIETAALLSSRIRADVVRRRTPITVPTFQVDPKADPQFGSYGLGDFARFDLTDYRFPSGYVNTWRVIGWTVTPSSSESTDTVQLVIEGSE